MSFKEILRHPLTLPVYIPTLILAFSQGMLAPVLPLYVRSFQAPFGLVGLVIAAQGLGMLLGDIPAGILLGRLGQKRSMLTGIGVLAGATLAMSWARSVPELFAYGLVGGIGMALWNISRHAYLTDSSSLVRRGRSIALFGGINRVGVFLGPAVGGILAEQAGLRTPFMAFAVLALAAMIFPALFAQETASSRRVHRGGLRGHTLHMGKVLREHWRILSAAGTGQLLAQMIRAGRNIVIPLYGAEVIGLSVQDVGFIVSLSWAVDMSLFYVAGVVMDRYGRKFAYVPCFAIQGIGMALVTLTGSFGGLLAASLVIGVGNGLGSGTMMTLGSDLAPKDAMGEFLGVWRLIGDTGASGGPVVVGAVADILSLPAATLVIAGVGLLASTVFALFVPETLEKPVRSLAPGD